MKLIDVYADWCNPCKVQSQILDNLQEIFPNLEIQKLDADNPDNQDFIDEQHVRNLPALFLYDGEKLLWKTTGLTTQTAIETELKKYNNETGHHVL